MANKDITSMVERLEAFEDRLGVRIEAVSAFEVKYDNMTCVEVRGELHSTNGTSIEEPMTVNVSVYDADGRVVHATTDFVSADKFFGFHTFNTTSVLDAGVAKKIRLFPTAR